MRAHAREKRPSKRPAAARAVPDDSRWAQQPQWVRTRVSELEAELKRLEVAVRAIRVAVTAADDGNAVELEDEE